MTRARTYTCTCRHGWNSLFTLLCFCLFSSSNAFVSTEIKRNTPTFSTIRHGNGCYALLPTTEDSETKLNPSTKKSVLEVESIRAELSSEKGEPSIWGIPRSTAGPLALLLLSQFLLFIGVGAVIPTIPLYGKELGLSSAANGVVISAPALALLVLAKPFGSISDQARKPAMLWGMAVIALSDLATALSPASILPLLGARLCLGAGRCLAESGERGMLADLASTVPSRRARILSMQPVMVSLGIAIGAPAGGYVVEQYGPRASFLCVTGAATLALCLYLLLPETTSLDREEIQSLDNNNALSSSLSSTNGEPSPPEVSWAELIQDPKWRGLALFEVGAKFGFAAKLASIPILAAAILPGGAVGAGTLLSAAGLSGLVGGPMGGFLSDRIGSKNTMAITGLASAAGLIAIPFAVDYSHVSSPEIFTASVLVWSTSVAAQNPAVNSLAQELSPPGQTASATALPRACGDAVLLVGPFVLGAIADASAFPRGTECAFAGLCGLLGVSALAIL